MKFTEHTPQSITENPFDLLNKQWGLLAAGKPDDFNMMTVSWGQMGVLWNKPIVTVYVRPQRYTKGYIDSGDYFTLSFFPEKYRPALSLCGSKSGRDFDKMGSSGLAASVSKGTVLFEEARLVFVCKKLYTGKIDKDGFEDGELIKKNYPDGDFHTYYIGQIEKVLRKED